MIKQDLIDRLPELSVDQLMITLIQAEMVFAFSKTPQLEEVIDKCKEQLFIKTKKL